MMCDEGSAVNPSDRVCLKEFLLKLSDLYPRPPPSLRLSHAKWTTLSPY
jgi:hypothetical protein